MYFEFQKVVAALCISNFKKLSVVDFCAQVGDLISKTVLVESEESNSDLRASGNRVT